MDGPDVGWYLIVAAILFGIGSLGVMLRRSPLIVLLSLEIMLNAGSLTLIAFARQQGSLDGQVFALAVMAVAAAEVAIGLGLIVAMTLFLGLEWFSLCLYVLVAFDTDRAASLEAALKYLIVGGFGSAVLLFGSALVYGATGEIGFSQIAAAGAGDDAFLLAGLAMILAGLAFKVSAAPFHMWTPDVYQGAPTSVTAFMSAATKTAAMVVTLRLLVTAFPEESDIWTIAVAVLACVSLAWGNLAALAQRDLKRLLAYSSISHAGFLLIAVAAASERGVVRRRASRRRGAQLGARAHVHPADDVQVVRERDGGRRDPHQHEPPVARVVGRGEDEELPEEPAREREAREPEHDRTGVHEHLRRCQELGREQEVEDRQRGEVPDERKRREEGVRQADDGDAAREATPRRQEPDGPDQDIPHGVSSAPCRPGPGCRSARDPRPARA